MKKWTTIQLGSREHYAIPRVLHQKGLLKQLITDSWIPRKSQPLVGKLSQSLALRRHLEVPDDKVTAATLRRVIDDLRLKIGGVDGWDAIVRRNDWFQKWAAGKMTKLDGKFDVCFSYSYTARLPFLTAKKLGIKCVLGQIDPGPIEQKIVDSETSGYENLKLENDIAPPEQYWEQWREEIQLADQILVNSAWSSDLLVRQGVSESKILIMPLAYEGKGVPATHSPRPPYTKEPLTVLFLGQVILRKGVGQLFDAIRLLYSRPIRFVFAGPVGVRIPEDISANPKVKILGAVDRGRAQELYRSSDIFILPTLSDGFAITQLEALAHGLPVIASKACGSVVIPGKNGLLLEQVTPRSIADSLINLLENGLLPRLRQNSMVPDEFNLQALGSRLENISK